VSSKNEEAGTGDLRAQAARRVGSKSTFVPKILAASSPEEVLRLVHELQVHQVELEMQNEELRRADDRLRHLEKAESLVRMAGAIGHHFNNSLQVVIGNLELAMGGPAGDAGSAELLREAMKGARQAAEMSALMLAFVGQTDQSRTQLDLSQACRWTLPLLRASLPSGVQLETEFQASGPIVKAHADQLQQVLVSLLTNAGEAVGTSGGAVRLAVKTIPPADISEAHRFPVDWEPTQDAYACLEVVDTGRGIAGEDLDRVFDPFYSGRAAGRGLGLSVSLGIARAHGGAVSVRSEPGLGSTFRVYLPLSSGSVPPPPKKAPPFEAGGTVLVVDDEALVLRVCSSQLMGLGFTVLEATSGAEAAGVLAGHREAVRLVLCDLSMPGMNGWETLAALRKFAPDIPVILTSGYDRAQVMAGSHPELPQAFLRKPYGAAELREAVRVALRGAAKAGEAAASPGTGRSGGKE
jgi:signal transduction histidine kinase/ActR/RegA family two-component response regulator